MATIVNCYLHACKYLDQEECVCTKDEITLEEEHYCEGGCDDGWEFDEEEGGIAAITFP